MAGSQHPVTGQGSKGALWLLGKLQFHKQMIEKASRIITPKPSESTGKNEGKASGALSPIVLAGNPRPF